jgi:hypothetical protein
VTKINILGLDFCRGIYQVGYAEYYRLNIENRIGIQVASYQSLCDCAFYNKCLDIDYKDSELEVFNFDYTSHHFICDAKDTDICTVLVKTFRKYKTKFPNDYAVINHLS